MRKRLSHVLVERLRWRPCGPRVYKSPCPTRRPAEDFAKQILQSATATDADAEAVIQLKPAVSEPCRPKLDRVAFDDAAQQSLTSGHLPASCDLLAKPAKQFREEKALSCKAQAAARPRKRESDHSPVQQPAKSARRSDAAVNAEEQRLATAVEVFSGTGILSRALMSHGFQTMAVDHQPRSSLVPVVRLDLCKDSRQQLLQEELSANHPDALHLAPPCGTSSRKTFWLKVPNLRRGGLGTISVLLNRLERHGSLGRPFARRAAGARRRPDRDGDSPAGRVRQGRRSRCC